MKLIPALLVAFALVQTSPTEAQTSNCQKLLVDAKNVKQKEKYFLGEADKFLDLALKFQLYDEKKTDELFNKSNENMELAVSQIELLFSIQDKYGKLDCDLLIWFNEIDN